MLTYGDANAIYTEVTKAENARSIGHNSNRWIWIVPILQDGAYRLPLLD